MKREKGILLSPQHGLNPAIPACFWCGEEKNEVVLFGKLKGDMEAPQNAVIDYVPCDKCKEKMDLGITLIEALHESNGWPQIQEGSWPTGRWIVVTENFIQRVFEDSAVEKVLKVRSAFVEPSMMKLFEGSEATE